MPKQITIAVRSVRISAVLALFALIVPGLAASGVLETFMLGVVCGRRMMTPISAE
jgi:hypothetical protein